ncbi:MAG: hypothetical protein KKB50_16300 [Planctomycetes bacterium]|nr:hypothetical protein [Planctomycetota bacterium]
MNTVLTAINGEVVSAVVLAWLGQALLFGTVLAALTWLLRRLLRHWIRPGLETALWALVLIKFIVPVGPGWSFSLASLCGLGAVAPDRTAMSGDSAVEWAALAPGTANGQPNDDTQRAVPALSWRMLVSAAYLASVLSLLVLRSWSYFSYRACCRGLPRADEDTQQLVRGVCARLGVARVPMTRISNSAPAPFVMGFLHPLLVLSHRQLVRPDELETVVVHEVTHLRRGDLLVRFLQWFAGTLLFFWPVVAWINRRIDRVCESACDEWALRHGKLTAGEYARCLLNALPPPRAGKLAYQPACMAGNCSMLERRIDMILKTTERPQRRRAWGLVTVAFLLVWGGFTLTGSADDKDKKTKYAATEASMRLHAKTVYARVSEYDGGDLDGDGETTKEECWAFITAAVLNDPGPVLKEFPNVDENEDDKLSLSEAYYFVRGDRVIEELHKKAQKAIGAAKEEGNEELVTQLKEDLFAAEMDAWHFILDRRELILDVMGSEPTLEFVKKVSQKSAMLDGKKVGDSQAKEIELLKQKIAQLEADGKPNKAAALRKKLAQLQADGNSLKDMTDDDFKKQITKLKSAIAELEQQGETKKAAELEHKLQEMMKKRQAQKD